MPCYWVYILTNYRRVLYVGMTNNLARRVDEHRSKRIEGFTSKYKVTELVYYEETHDVRLAIEREKQIKGWTSDSLIVLLNCRDAGPRLQTPP